MNLYNKPALNIDAQISKLKSDITIQDCDLDFIANFLQHNLYSRFSWYIDFAKQYRLGNNQLDFQDVYELYKFDKSLRTCIFKYIEEIEVAFKALIFNKFSRNFGTDWLYKKHIIDKSIISKVISKTHNNVFVNSFKTKNPNFQNNNQVSCWVLSENFTFSDVSRLFENLIISDPNSKEYDTTYLRTQAMKEEISSAMFGLNSYKVVADIMHSLTELRNFVAHHDPIIDCSSYTKKLILPQNTIKLLSTNSINIANGYENQIFVYLYWINRILNNIRPNHNLMQNIQNIANSFNSSELSLFNISGIPILLDIIRLEK